MPIRVEIYGATGVAIGVVARQGRLRDILDDDGDLLVERVTWHPIDGTTPQPCGELSVTGDDILIAVADVIGDLPVHAQWHDISLDVGPYRVTGSMPTMPGFDPGRALARPSGEFVLLRDVRIALASDADGGAVEQPAALVNRYVVDRVAADLMLGFYFPGAEMIVTGGHEQGAAGVAALVPPPDPAPTPASL
ncbi:MAG TPA: hypothetical protein VFK35_01335 [Candidatus Limnocylindrales bacterium]|nr:hypothetical protein [Candidatus Limnocylindrales bacterium]